jgi:ADP-heptose:LPS heptosyltransferase
MATSKIRVAVLQLTRIGDLIQTMQAVRQLKAEKSNVEVVLIARRKFADGLRFLLETVFDEIILFDTSDFFAKRNFKDAQTNVHNFVSDLNKNEFDLVINLSFSKSSSYLASLIDSKYQMGIGRNKNSDVIINDKWSQYIYSTVMSSTNNPFSLVDIYRYITGSNMAHRLSSEVPVAERENTIVLHPFASLKKKRWGVSKWSELIHKLAKENHEFNFVIVGGKEDLVEADRIAHSPAIAQFNNRIQIRVGDSSIADTYQLLMNSKLFIGHDSMVSHLASETLTPSIVLSLGTVRPHETSAYHDNLINISPKNSCFPCKVSDSCELLPCHNSINFQTVSTVAYGLLNQHEINSDYLVERLTPFQLDSARIHMSELTENGLELKEISNNHQTMADVFKEYYKVIWQYYLRGVDVDSGLPDITAETANQLSSYLDGTNYLYELYNFGVKYSNKIISECEATHPNPEVIKENINKLGEIDKLCSVTKTTYPYLTDLVDFFYVNKANAMGDTILDISKHNLLTYYDASNLVAVLNEFIDKSVSPYIAKQEINKEV